MSYLKAMTFWSKSGNILATKMLNTLVLNGCKMILHTMEEVSLIKKRKNNKKKGAYFM